MKSGQEHPADRQTMSQSATTTPRPNPASRTAPQTASSCQQHHPGQPVIATGTSTRSPQAGRKNRLDARHSEHCAIAVSPRHDRVSSHAPTIRHPTGIPRCPNPLADRAGRLSSSWTRRSYLRSSERQRAPRRAPHRSSIPPGIALVSTWERPRTPRFTVRRQSP